MTQFTGRQVYNIPLVAFKNYKAAGEALKGLAQRITLTKKDEGSRILDDFIKNQDADWGTSPVLNDLKAHRARIRNLVDDFFNKKVNMDEATFKDKWRDLVPNTDEHLSTDSMFTLLNGFKTKFGKSLANHADEVDILKNFATVASFFRLPTKETGHAVNSVVGNQWRFGHPRGPNDSTHYPGYDSPEHYSFDMCRRATSFIKASHNVDAGMDGTQVLTELLRSSANFTTHWVSSAYASDVSLRQGITPFEKYKLFRHRECIKFYSNRLREIPLARTPQLANTRQFWDSATNSLLAPSARSVIQGPPAPAGPYATATGAAAAGRLRERSETPPRDEPVSLLVPPATTAIDLSRKLLPYEIFEI